MRTPQIAIILAVISLAATVHAAVIRPDAPADEPLISWRVPVVAAPVMADAPTIDGVIDRAEWTAAAQLAPLVALDSALMTDLPHEAWIGYSDEALHVAFRFRRPTFAPPPNSGTDPLGVWRDDCMEMFLKPPGLRGEYNFVGNAAGLHEEGLRTSATDKRWAVQWSYAARITETGWEGELSIPFAEIGQSPQPGETWGFTITNNQRTPRGEPSSWSWLREWKSERDLGFLVFSGRQIAARVLQAGEVSASEVGALVEVANFSEEDVTVRIAASLHQPKEADLSWFRAYDGAADPLAGAGDAEQDLPADEVLPRTLEAWDEVNATTHEAVVVPAGQARRVPFVHEAPRGSYALHYEVTDAATGAILAAGPLPFERRAPLEVVLTPYLLTASAVEVTADYRRVPGVSEGDELHVALRRAEGGDPLAQERVSVDVANGRSILDLDVSELPPGDYVVRCEIVPPGGESRAEREQDLSIAPPPDWWANPIGHPEETDTVPPPWTPMRRAGMGFSVWNREIVLGEALQPSAIVAGGSEMLADQVQLDLQAAGLTIGEPQCTLERKTGIVWEAPVSAEGLSGTLTLSAEFDGFMKYTLHLQPDGANAGLDRMVLEIPLPGEAAQYYNHASLGTPPGHDLVENRGDAGELEGELALPFSYSVWLGDTERGINWVAEDDQWWRPADPNRAIVMQREGEAASLRVNFVEERLEIDEPVTFEWAILATPSKPLDERFLRDLYLVQRAFYLNDEMTGLASDTGAYIRAMADAGANAFCQWSWGDKSVWNEDFSAPAYRPTPLNAIRRDALREAIEMSREAGIEHVILYSLWAVITDWPGIEPWWQEMPLHPLLPTTGGYKQCSARPFADWHLSELARTISEVGNTGVYLDGGASPRVCTNIHHGHGYVDEQGNLHGSYGVFGQREHLKRIYHLFHGGMIDDGLVYVHHSGVFLPAIESFADIHHGGEGSDFVMDDFIGKFYGRPFGLPVTFTRWNVPWYPERRINSWRLSLLADATIKATPQMVVSKTSEWPEGRRENLNKGYDDASQPVWWIWQAHKQFPFEGSRWLPHWEIGEFVQIGGDSSNLYAAMHLNEGRAALLTVSSFRDEPTQVELSVDWRGMGFDPATVTVTDAITGEPVPVTADGMTLEVLGQKFRLLQVAVAE